MSRITAALIAAAMLMTSCQSTVTPSPSAAPTATASPTPSRPRFELATYQYGLQTKGKIRVAIQAGVPPLTLPRTGTEAPAGFEPDLARRLATAIFGSSDDPDTHIEWIAVDGGTRLSALTSDGADITIATVPITADTKRVVELSDPYLTAGQRLLVKKANDQIKELADVATGEQTVCAVQGSPGEAEIRRRTNERARILPLATLDFCLRALQIGAADAVVGDEIALLGLVWKQPADLKLTGKAFATTALGIAMKKSVAGDREGFREFIDVTLLAIVADRSWARLYEKDVTPTSGDTRQLPSD